ncbi:hypothetical protein V2A60_001931 [Cordyceps javanica]
MLDRGEEPPFDLPPAGAAEPMTAPTDGDRFRELLYRGLPASYKLRNYDIASPRDDVVTYLKQELDMRRFKTLLGHLSWAGFIYPCRPLHAQLSIGRKLVINERTDLHLVLDNTSKRLYLKPIPGILFIPQFWTEYLSSLVSYESDFRIAKEEHLMPAQVDWPQWQSIVHQLDTTNIYHKIHPRFIYGELRLMRIDAILMLTGQRLIPSFAGRWNQYRTFVTNNITYIATATVFTGLILAAMQVGLSTDRLKSSRAYQAASEGFNVFTILFLLWFFGALSLFLAWVFVLNCFERRKSDKKRREHFQAY